MKKKRKTGTTVPAILATGNRTHHLPTTMFALSPFWRSLFSRSCTALREENREEPGQLLLRQARSRISKHFTDETGDGCQRGCSLSVTIDFVRAEEVISETYRKFQDSNCQRLMDKEGVNQKETPSIRLWYVRLGTRPLRYLPESASGASCTGMRYSAVDKYQNRTSGQVDKWTSGQVGRVVRGGNMYCSLQRCLSETTFLNRA